MTAADRLKRHPDAGPSDVTVWQTLKGQTDTVLFLTWSPDGTSLASSSLDGTICILGAKQWHLGASVERGFTLGLVRGLVLGWNATGFELA